MHRLENLLENNKSWTESIRSKDPAFFEKLSRQQTPDYLWIGCSDSRVPASEIVGLLPGELFVHRNLANAVIHTDLNCLSAIQFAVDVLKVKHVIVCGHYGCGGVRAPMEHQRLGLVDHWLRHIRDIYQKHEDTLREIADETQRWDRLCELNVRSRSITSATQPSSKTPGNEANPWRFTVGSTVFETAYYATSTSAPLDKVT